MKKFRGLFSFVLVVAVILGQLSLPSLGSAAAQYVSGSRTVSSNEILVGGETEVTLNIMGTPPINVVKPNDVILVIDKSGSMAPTFSDNKGEDKMANAKAAAKGFIDLMDLSQHRVGIVDFSGSIGTFPLTDNKDAAKAYIDTINANGSTATGGAIAAATELLKNHRPEAQPVIVLMTDGAATVGGNGVNAYDYALQKSEEAKTEGIVFYTIALLLPTENPELSAPNNLLRNMATTSHHHHFVLGSTGLSDIYSAIVQDIGLASAYDVVVKEIINSSFEIVPGSYENNIPKPTVEGNTLTWNFLELKKDVLQFKFKVRHKAETGAGVHPLTATGSAISYKDYLGSNRTLNLSNINITVKNPAPLITTVTPNKGLTVGGETIVLSGENFIDGLKVTFNGANAQSVEFINNKEVKVVVPAGKQGEAQIALKNPDGQIATATYIYFADPTVTGISPANGPLEGGNRVIIRGTNFMEGVTVQFGDKFAVPVQFNNSTSLYVTAPEGQAPGSVNVNLMNLDGTKVIVSNGYTYNEPLKMELLSITPTEGLVTGNEEVILNGNLFVNGAKVYFGSQEAVVKSYSNPQKMTVYSPVATTTGKVDIKVINPDGASSTLLEAFTYNEPAPPAAPEITAVTPSSGPLEGGTLVYVDGSNFVDGAKIKLAGAEVTTTFLTANRLRFKTTAQAVPGPANITVVNPDGQEVTLNDAFTFIAPPPKPDPIINKITPSSGPMAGGTLIYIDGGNYQAGVAVEFLKGSEVINTSAEFINATRIRLRTPAVNFDGAVTVKVINPDGKTVTYADGYTYEKPPELPEPVITTITPNVGNLKGGFIVEIKGSNFQKGATVSFGNITGLPLSQFVTSEFVRVIAPVSATAGSVDVTLMNPDGKSVTVADGFTYEESKPIISAVSPSNGPLAGGTLVYIDGQYFESGLTVTFNGSNISCDYISSNRVRFRTPAGLVPGAVPIIVTNPNGISTTATFTYDVPPAAKRPQITKLSATSGPVAGNNLLYVDGSNFVSGASIVFNGVTMDKVDFISATRLRIRVPAGVSSGMVEVKLINPDGQVSNIVTYEYK